MEIFRLDTSNAVWREIDGEIVVLGGGGSDYMAVNETGAVLWKCLQVGATVDELVAILTSTYEVSVDEAQADVARFITGLKKRNLLSDS